MKFQALVPRRKRLLRPVITCELHTTETMVHDRPAHRSSVRSQTVGDRWAREARRGRNHPPWAPSAPRSASCRHRASRRAVSPSSWRTTRSRRPRTPGCASLSNAPSVRTRTNAPARSAGKSPPATNANQLFAVSATTAWGAPSRLRTMQLRHLSPRRSIRLSSPALTPICDVPLNAKTRPIARFRLTVFETPNGSPGRSPKKGGPVSAMSMQRPPPVTGRALPPATSVHQRRPPHSPKLSPTSQPSSTRITHSGHAG